MQTAGAVDWLPHWHEIFLWLIDSKQYTEEIQTSEKKGQERSRMGKKGRASRKKEIHRQEAGEGRKEEGGRLEARKEAEERGIGGE
jgi:hypothetical protein